MSSSDEYVLFQYRPNAVVAGIFIGIFSLSLMIHGWQILRTRSWYFITIFIACQLEPIGYFGRILAHKDNTTIGPYLMQSIPLLAAPAIYAIPIHMLLGRLIVLVEAEKFSAIPVKWLTKILVAGDILSFVVLSTGGALLGTSKGDQSKITSGERAILGGLGIQIFFFTFFIIIIVLFHKRIQRQPTAASQLLLENAQSRCTWKVMLYVLYTVSALITVRSVFRVIEYAQGNDGFFMRSEVWMYVFDGGLMVLVSFLFNFYHPSRVLATARSGSAIQTSVEMT